MMRIGFLPSDFNPMILMLAEAEDCRALGGVLRQFARERNDIRIVTNLRKDDLHCFLATPKSV